MARVTVEDCVTRIPNRFDLVLLAARRARDISAGAPLTIDRDNDKNPVVALREIADATIDTGVVKDELIRAFQRHVEVEEPEESLMELSGAGDDFESFGAEPPAPAAAAESDEDAEEDEEEAGDEEAETTDSEED